MVQPPRGFGENPIAIYHDPDLAPTHHYLATYRWIEREFGAHAVVHMGKHGNLEWLPGKNLGLSAGCGADAALGAVPLIYPFLVNDPGEGTQAKRRAHATIVDHLVPPMARAESYGDIARLEQLLDEYGNVSAMDPAKAPALQGEIWTLIQAAQLHHDLGLSERPDEEEFGEFVMHVDGWLCEIKDVQIRDGLHVLGQPPAGEALVNLVLAILRSNQVFGGQVHGVPGLRTALGLDHRSGHARGVFGRSRWAQAKALVEALADAGWQAEGGTGDLVSDALRQAHGADTAAVELSAAGASPAKRWCRGWPRPVGRSTRCCMRWMAATCRQARPARRSAVSSTCCTGRNFYSVDPKAIPSGLALGDRAGARQDLLPDTSPTRGSWPPSVGLSVWGPRPCVRRGTTSPRCSPCWAWCRCGTRCPAGSVGPRDRCRWPSSNGRGSTSPYGSPASSVTPSRTWWPC